MATIIQLSETTHINLDMVTVIRAEDGQWQIFFADHAHALRLTAEEQAVLTHALRASADHRSFHAVRRGEAR